MRFTKNTKGMVIGVISMVAGWIVSSKLEDSLNKHFNAEDESIERKGIAPLLLQKEEEEEEQ